MNAYLPFFFAIKIPLQATDCKGIVLGLKPEGRNAIHRGTGYLTSTRKDPKAKSSVTLALKLG